MKIRDGELFKTVLRVVLFHGVKKMAVLRRFSVKALCVTVLTRMVMKYTAQRQVDQMYQTALFQYQKKMVR